MSVGNRIYLKRKLPEKNLVARFEKLPAANVADCMSRSFTFSPELKLMSSPVKKMCGVALTVKTHAGDNLMVSQALEMAQEGDVVVIANEGHRQRAMLGEIIYRYLADFKKVAGIVIDGPIRDIDVIADEKCPIYATGTTPAGPYKSGPGEINTPISLGHVVVMPGDIVLGDQDGLLVIPQGDAQNLIEKAEENAASDAAKVAAAKAGKIDHSWLKKALTDGQVEMIDEIYPG
ncbi:RraA family protein [Enterococcus sp. HY326]|uniref:RraA family protein n=1 Tax=Enterococcus sp. HY326 TaxID=2971265 RepID=UPI0022401FCC|nr:RraA family protein [Enterococcus sp. HY326]